MACFYQMRPDLRPKNADLHIWGDCRNCNEDKNNKKCNGFRRIWLFDVEEIQEKKLNVKSEKK